MMTPANIPLTKADDPLSLESPLARLLHHPATAWLFLFVSLLLTLLGWYIANESVQQRTADRFYFETEDIKNAITQRMQHYQQALLGGVGLFAASKDVGRQEWRAYVTALRLSENLPGIQGMGFSLRIPADEKISHLQTIRAEGFPNYNIKPNTIREEFHSIIYLEPFEGRNLRAFGYDMYSEPIRQAAMNQARDTGAPAISGRVTLVQETDQNVQAGFLMYLPVYRNGQPSETVEQRRAALQGFVYGPFRVNDLMTGILDAGSKDLEFELFDGDPSQAESLLYTSNPTSSTRHSSSTPTRRTTVKIGGQMWTITFYARAGFLAASGGSQPTVVGLLGLLVDLLFFYILRSSTSVKKRAVALANRMTAELCDNQKRLELAMKGADIDFWDWNMQTGAVFFDVGWATRLGYQPEEIAPHYSTWHKLIHPDDMPHVQAIMSAHLRGDLPLYETEHRLRTKAGTWVWVLARGKVLERNEQGQPLRMAGTRFDITKRKEIEEKLSEKNAEIEAVVQAFPDLYFWLDADGTIQQYYANRLSDLYLPPEQFIGKKMQEILPPQVGQLFLTTLSQALHSGTVTGIEYDLQANGEKKFEARFSPLQDNRALVVVRDITERTQFEQQLLASEEKFAKIFHSSPNAMAVQRSGDLTYLAVNERWLQITGLSKEEVIGRRVEEVEHWVSADLRATAHAQLCKHKVFRDLEVTLSHKKTGVETIGLVSTELIRTGSELCVLGVIQDITERKHQEAELRDNQLRLAGLIDSAMDAIISITAAQKVSLFNAAAEEMFGYRSDEMLGQPIAKLLPVSFRDLHAQHVRSFGEAGMTSRQMGALGTINGLRSNGEEFPIEASISHTFVGGERIYTVILRDVSQRLELERLKREFISTVSHELRTPLTSIRGSLGLLTTGALGELTPPHLENGRDCRAQ